MLKKSTSVFWVLSDEGIVLNNHANGFFIELGQLQEKVWAYCDGSKTIEDIISTIRKTRIVGDVDMENAVRGCIDLLLTNGFLYTDNMEDIYEQR